METEHGITEGRAILKRGKLIKVWARFKGEKILDIRITGDFFIYPEDTIERIEEGLKNRKISEVMGIVEEIMKGCEYIGIEPKDIEEAVNLAWKKN